MPFEPKTLPLYPEEPGVYLMKDLSGKVLYIGKAKNLRSRLKQYFTAKGDERAMIPFLVSQIETIDPIVVLTEKDALILENQLIKKYLPKYNVLLRDDKTFIHLMFTQHPWPILRLVRHSTSSKEKGIYFGPYTNTAAARQVFDLISRLFPLRQCSDAELMNRQRPCLLYEIKRCLAPCVGKCTKEEYAWHVEAAQRLLKGKTQELLQNLKEEMEKASHALDFEKAAALLKTLRQIEHVTERQHVKMAEDENCDVVGLYREGDHVTIALLMFREGKLIGSEPFSFSQIASEDSDTLESFLLQHYKNQPSLPREVFLPILVDHQDALSEIISLKFLTPQKGKKREWVEMAQKNAKALFAHEQDTRLLREKMLLDLQETLQLTRYPRRIECFDTSNLSQSNPVASLACFVDGEKDKSKKRLFKIKGIEMSDDYTAMKQVLHRHFAKQKENNDFCDLLIVDGGKGHLHLALEVFEMLGIASIDVIAVTKEKARHDKGLSQEKIYVPHRKDPFLIDPRSSLLFLLQRIRDTAHDQAIAFHRKKRSQRLISSELDEIPGIGPKKKQNLLRHFGSIAHLKEASDADLMQVPLLTEKDRKTLRHWIESGKRN